MQTVFLEMETVIANRPLTYYYPSESQTCVTPNHLLFGRNLTLCYPNPVSISTESLNLKNYSLKIHGKDGEKNI